MGANRVFGRVEEEHLGLEHLGLEHLGLEHLGLDLWKCGFCGDRPLRSADAIAMYFALFLFMLRIIADFPSDHDKGLFQIKKYAKAG